MCILQISTALNFDIKAFFFSFSLIPDLGPRWKESRRSAVEKGSWNHSTQVRQRLLSHTCAAAELELPRRVSLCRRYQKIHKHLKRCFQTLLLQSEGSLRLRQMKWKTSIEPPSQGARPKVFSLPQKKNTDCAQR